MLESLAELSRISTASSPDVDQVRQACDIAAKTLRASDAYVLQAGDPHFVRLGSDDDPTTYEIKQKGYWIIRQTFAANPGISAGLFDAAERIVQSGRDIIPDLPSTHLGSALPGDESNSDLLIVRGPWPNGLSQAQIDFVIAARPMLAYLVANVIDTQRRARQRQQLTALADVSKAFNEASEMDHVLESVATALAKASGFDWVMITLYNDALDTATERAVNIARYSGTETATLFRQGRYGSTDSRTHEPAKQTTDEGAFLRDLVRWGHPFLMSDVLSPELDDMPELQPHMERFAQLRAYYVRAHIISTALFPIMFQNTALGLAAFSSSTKREFSQQEVDLLHALVSQAATTIKGLRLYHDLEASPDELRHYAEKLEAASRVEHLLARTDALTGLPNRRYIEEAMEAECARSGRYQQPVTVAMADIDHFKEINDGFGHQTGDDALRFVATVARQACRTSDFVGRWGGDEFVFILPSTNLVDATGFANRFRSTLSDTDFAHTNVPKPVRMTISIGVAQATPDTFTDSPELLERADKSLYRAKENGRDRVEAAPLPTNVAA
ncbi:MAG: sensor domain-containing diguanylate cyclase [Dehalococcoidia bacterium]